MPIISRPAFFRLVVLLVVPLLAGLGLVVTAGVARADDVTVSYDVLRTGWDRNEATLSPSDVSASDFGQLFGTRLNGQIYAQPVVARNVVMAVTENNNVYGLDPVSGAIKWSRNVGRAWPASAVGCGDLVPTIGITSTPTVDAATGTAYFTSKVDDGPDANNPHWYLHAVDIMSGAERSGFPTTIQGSASNDHSISFNPKTAMQRPGLLLLGGVVYAAFGSHCDVQPYVGFVVGVDGTTGRQTAMWAAAIGASTAGAGIWQSGGGPVSDGPGRIIVATGNGVSPPPGPGTPPPGTLAESVIRLQVNSDGSLISKDFFSPINNTNLDTDDTDVGAGGPMGLPDGFGTSAHPHVLVEVGKDGRIFLLDRDNFGGVAQGTGGKDAVLQTAGPYKGVWGHPAFWGGDGGYVYLIHNQGPLSAFKIGATAGGVPTLTRVAVSTGNFGYTSGSPVVTSDGTTSGPALVWGVYSDGSNGSGGQLRAYDALPSNGVLNLRYAAPIGTAAKFSVPATDKGRVYVGNRDGILYGFGRPTTVALQGNPTDYGAVAVGSTATKTITVTAQRAVTVNSLSANSPFTAGAVTLPQTLNTGQALSVPVTFAPTAPTSVSGALTFGTSVGTIAFDLHGQGTRDGLDASPSSVAFGEVPTGGQVSSNVSIRNIGTTTTRITGTTPPSAPFTVSSPPVIGSTLAPGASFSVPVTFAPTAVGNASSSLAVASSTGSVTVPLSGTGVTGAAQLSITPMDIDFGSVQMGHTVTKAFDITNTGNLVLTLTKAAAPSAPFQVASPVAEGQQLSPGDTIRQSVTFAPTTFGPVTGVYQITGNDGTGAKTVSLRGQGGASAGPTGPVLGPSAKCLDVRSSQRVDGTPVQIWSCNRSSAQVWTLTASNTVRALDKCLDVLGGGTPNGTPVQLWTCNGTAAQTWNMTPTGTLVNPQSGRCLDLPNSNITDGTALQIWDCNGTAAQQWPPGLAVSTASASAPVIGPSSKCLDIRSSDTADGTPVQIWSCNGTNAQAWSLTRDNTFQAMGKCLDVSGSGTTNGTRLQLWTCNGTAAQTWYPTMSGAVVNPQSMRCVDVPNSDTRDGTALQLYDCNGTSAQRWQPTLKVAATTAAAPVVGTAAKCLDVRWGGTADGTPVQIWGCNASGAQEWSMTPNGTLEALGKCMDVSNSGVTDGTRVQLWSCNATGAQTWYATLTGFLVNPQSGRCLDLPNGNAVDGSQMQIWGCNGSSAQRWRPVGG